MKNLTIQGILIKSQHTWKVGSGDSMIGIQSRVPWQSAILAWNNPLIKTKCFQVFNTTSCPRRIPVVAFQSNAWVVDFLDNGNISVYSILVNLHALLEYNENLWKYFGLMLCNGYNILSLLSYCLIMYSYFTHLLPPRLLSFSQLYKELRYVE